MNLITKTQKILFSIILLPIFCGQSYAEQIADPEPIYCAAVVPDCDLDGNPLAPFDDYKSFCFEMYSNICLRQLVIKLQVENSKNCRRSGKSISKQKSK